MTSCAEQSADLAGKRRRCKDLLKDMGRVVVAFSGGVDSTLLLALAAETLGPDNVLAAVGVSPSLPQRERQAAGELTRRIGVERVELDTHELDDPRYASNPAERCYYCKSDLFGRLAALARERGFAAVASGANADDVGDFRPGLRAGRELGVRNPLMEASLSKAEVRQLSREMDLPTWDKPAMACLASRIPYGEPITPDRLRRVERAEAHLRDLGFGACRVRDHAAVARIEVPAADLPALVQARQGIVAAFKALGYTYVAVDLEGLRSGSMNEALGLSPAVGKR